MIQGDGIGPEDIDILLNNLEARGWSADNLNFGMGGGLLQKVNRDTYKFAMKCSAIKIDGVWKDVYKDPITDPGKTSKKGRLGVQLDADNEYETKRIEDINPLKNQLELVFLNGRLEREQTFEDIRARAWG